MQHVLEAGSRLAQLAFLYAYEAVENKTARLTDKMMHIASAFYIVSFSHVMGLMWPSNDDVCVSVSTHFYANLARVSSQEQDGRAPTRCRERGSGTLCKFTASIDAVRARWPVRLAVS